jgi:hypothetical protein
MAFSVLVIPMTAALIVFASLFLAQDTVNTMPTNRSVAADLRENGLRVETERAILLFQPGQLSSEEMERFAGLVDEGIGHLQEYLGVPPQERRIQYFVSDRIEVSYSSYRSVFLPLSRVKEHSAPYLHESSHVLAPCHDCPMWFSEGLASYLQSWISENRGGYDGIIFTRYGNRGIDRDARRWLNGERGQAVLPYIGKHGEPPTISYDRSNVAAPFYVMSQSFVKYLAEKAGMEKLRLVIGASDFEGEMVEATGKSSEQWKVEWLASLGG